jgi:hypothetical protein
MNVSIAQVAHDVGTDIHGIQIALTTYTLTMASFMIAGERSAHCSGDDGHFEWGSLSTDWEVA